VHNVDVDNCSPYNPWLLKKYGAHINVEAFLSIKSVEYLYKCIYKGHDCIKLKLQERLNHDEFLDVCYVSAPKAAWKLFEFPMHHQPHTIIRLAIHLPD